MEKDTKNTQGDTHEENLVLGSYTGSSQKEPTQEEDCAPCEYMKGIRGILETLPRGLAGSVILSIPPQGKYDTIYLSDSTQDIFVADSTTGDEEHMAGMCDGSLYTIYCHLDANKHTLASRDEVVEVSGEKAKDWDVEPQPIIVEGGSADGETLGMVGIAKVPTDNGTDLRSVVFVSPDGTYANLTMYPQGNETETSLAQDDVKEIATFLLKFAQNIK